MIETKFLVDGEYYDTYEQAKVAEDAGKKERIKAVRQDIINNIGDILSEYYGEAELYSDSGMQAKKRFTFLAEGAPFSLYFQIVQHKVGHPSLEEYEHEASYTN